MQGVLDIGRLSWVLITNMKPRAAVRSLEHFSFYFPVGYGVSHRGIPFTPACVGAFGATNWFLHSRE